LYSNLGQIFTPTSKNILSSENEETSVEKGINIRFKSFKNASVKKTITYTTNIQKQLEDSEYFDYESEKSQELTIEEKIVYGSRCPKGYTKLKLIGK
jgi:hypothetical protein